MSKWQTICLFCKVALMFIVVVAMFVVAIFVRVAQLLDKCYYELHFYENKGG